MDWSEIAAWVALAGVALGAWRRSKFESVLVAEVEALQEKVRKLGGESDDDDAESDAA